MEEAFAVEHKPNPPFSADLPYLRSVNFGNIDIGKWYYMVTDERLAPDAYDSIVKVVDTDDDDPNLKVLLNVWTRPRDLSLPWEQERDHPEILRFSENQVANGTFKFYEYDDDIVMQNGGGLVEDINARLDDPSYILPAGTVARRAPVAMRMTPPFFPRKTLRRGRKNRRRALPSSVSRRRRSTRRANKKRLTRKRR
jgi:hypothetical protein